MRKHQRAPTSVRSQPARWWRAYWGGCLLLVLSLGAVGACAHIESGATGFAIGVMLVAGIIGACVAVFDADVLPAAALAVVGLLLVGIELRTVLPRPATTYEFASHQMLPQYAGSHTVPGARNRKSVTHSVIPVVPRDWQRGSALDVWVFDPPGKNLEHGPVRGLRLSLSDRDTARAAWQAALTLHALPVPAAEPTFVELVHDPQAHDRRRVGLMLASVAALLGLWVLGKPVTRVWGRGRPRRS